MNVYFYPVIFVCVIGKEKEKNLIKDMFGVLPSKDREGQGNGKLRQGNNHVRRYSNC